MGLTHICQRQGTIQLQKYTHTKMVNIMYPIKSRKKKQVIKWLSNLLSLFLISCFNHSIDLQHVYASEYTFVIPIHTISAKDSSAIKRKFKEVQNYYPSFKIKNPGLYIAYTSYRGEYSSWLYLDTKDTVKHKFNYCSKSDVGSQGDGCFTIEMGTNDFNRLTSIPFEKMTPIYVAYDGLVSLGSNENVYGILKMDNGDELLFNFYNIESCLKTRCLQGDKAPLPYFLNDYQQVFNYLAIYFPNKTMNLQ